MMPLRIIETRIKWHSIETFRRLNKCIFQIDADQVRMRWLSFTQELTQAIHSLLEIL